MKTNLHNIPFLGVGLSYRSNLSVEVIHHHEKIDFVEIIADHYIDCPPEKLDELKLLLRYFTVIPHAINLSLGSVEGVDADYLRKLAALIKIIDPPYWSEHIAYTKVGGIEIGHLSPLPFREESVETIVRNIEKVNLLIHKPLILENISYLVNVSGIEMEEGEFLHRIFERVDCGLLLDVTNLWYNSQNHHYDVDLFIKSIPVDKVIQLHFTGGIYEQGKFIDNHSSKTPPEVWKVMEKVLRRSQVKGIILERDDSSPDFNEIMDDISIARELSGKIWN